MNDWQSIGALAIVGITATVFIWRAWRSRKKEGCGGGCGCPMKPKDVRR
jgi:hypothetical protein